MLDEVPHFSTFGKNYTRRFKDTDLFEQIFSHILDECMKYHLVDTSVIFADATHVKACANNKKMRRRIAKQEALWYEEELQKEIDEDRKAHGKKPLKDKDDHNQTPPSAGGGNPSNEEEALPEGVKTQKSSTSDPDSGWFRKGEHKHVFAYGIETACDKHGWILGYSIHPGNEHDSRTFKTLYDKLLSYHPEKMVLDAGYKTPAIAHLLIEDQIEPLFPYKCPQTKKGFFKKYEYVYDEYYDLRKETIERIFGTAKEQHGFRYTQYKGKARMEMKVGLTYACMNLKKLAKILAKKEQKAYDMLHSLIKETRNSIHTEKLVLELNSSTNFVYSLKWGRSIFQKYYVPI